MSNATQELEYRGRRLTAEPSNIGLDGVVHQLREGRTVYVCLEPGDATRYDLLIVPFSGIRGNTEPTSYRIARGNETAHNEGLPTWAPDEEHYVVTRLIGMRPVYSAVIWQGCWDGEHRNLAQLGGRAGHVNDWTHELLTWWFARLWDHQQGAQGAHG